MKGFFIMNDYSQIEELFNIKSPVGYTAQEITQFKNAVGELPKELEQFYLKYGKTPQLLANQDYFLSADEILHKDYIIFFNENQGVCQAGIKKSDAHLDNPPIYVGDVDSDEWTLSCEKLSDFLIIMFNYQALFYMQFNTEEFFEITQQELEKIEKLFNKKSPTTITWCGDTKISVYGNNNQHCISIFEYFGEYQFMYSANNQEEFEKIENLIGDMGEPI